jgi:hypothetical protein
MTSAYSCIRGRILEHSSRVKQPDLTEYMASLRYRSVLVIDPCAEGMKLRAAGQNPDRLEGPSPRSRHRTSRAADAFDEE